MKKSSSRESETSTSALIEGFCAALAEGEPVRMRLPGRGLIQMDRRLPFIFVYRRPPKREDKGTERLLRAEASYLIAAGDRRYHALLSSLLQAIIATLTDEFEAFMILELWAAEAAEWGTEFDSDWTPQFRIVVPRNAPPVEPIEALDKHLREVKLFQKSAKVETTSVRKLTPHGLLPLLSPSQAEQLHCSLLGLEVVPVYRDAESGVFPLTVRRLRRQLSRALKRSVYQFSRNCTTHSPASYLALGRRGLPKVVFDIDKRLSAISDAFDFLLHVTPVNVDTAWKEFRRGRFEKSPVFVYRPLPVDPTLLKRKLFEIPVERIADPALEQLFRDKQMEMDRKLTMFLDRGTQQFLYGSLQLYGPVTDDLLRLAEEILRRVPSKSRAEPKDGWLGATELAKEARMETEYYRQMDPTFSAAIEVREDVFSVMVSDGVLLIGSDTRVPRFRVPALLQHEIGTHVVTYFNGRAQPLRILYSGLASYDELQEGLAVLSEYLVGGLTRWRLRILAGRVVAAHNLLEGASFVDTFRLLRNRYRFDQQAAFKLAMRIYRGGGLTKDAIYLRGLKAILNYIANGSSLDVLLVGKVASPYLSVVRELRMRQVLCEPQLRPRYFDMPEAHERLEKLRSGVSVLDLTKEV